MTEIIKPPLAVAEAELDKLCRRVGLARTANLPAVQEMHAPPEGATLWTSSYAHLMLWPVGQDGQTLAQVAEAGEAWFDEWLMHTERSARGRSIDGYLVLALLNAPQNDEREHVRRLELSTHVCRKHVIWPNSLNNGEAPLTEWTRLADITMLGLPEAGAPPKAELEWPELDSEAMALWTDLVSLGLAATLQKDQA